MVGRKGDEPFMSISDAIQTDLEQTLIAKAKKKDGNAFETLVRTYEKTVYNVAYRLLPNEEDAKDMTQEVFIKIYKNIDKYNESAKFSTWVYTITYNTCIDEIRKRKNKTALSMDAKWETSEGEISIDLPDSSPSPEDVLMTKETKNEVQQAINRMNDEHKTFLIMRDIQDLSYNEIAEIASVSLGTVKSKISRARGQLKKILVASREQNETVHV